MTIDLKWIAVIGLTIFGAMNIDTGNYGGAVFDLTIALCMVLTMPKENRRGR